MNKTSKIICLAVIILLTGFNIYCWMNGDAIADSLYTFEVVWGQYVWADVYAGFLLMSTLIYAYERNFKFTLLLFILTCCTGNMINAAWLIWRGPDLYRRLTR